MARLTIRGTIHRLCWDYFMGINRLTARQLNSLKRRTEGLSTTNCGWLEYQLRHATLDMIRESRAQRPKTRRAKGGRP